MAVGSWAVSKHLHSFGLSLRAVQNSESSGPRGLHSLLFVPSSSLFPVSGTPSEINIRLNFLFSNLGSLSASSILLFANTNASLVWVPERGCSDAIILWYLDLTSW